MNPDDPPYRVNDKEWQIDLSGRLVPWANDQPVLVTMPNTPDHFLPVFSTKNGLCQMMAAVGLPFEKIKQIEDGLEFLSSLPLAYGQGRLRIALDLHFTPEGRVRFKEIVRPAIN